MKLIQTLMKRLVEDAYLPNRASLEGVHAALTAFGFANALGISTDAAQLELLYRRALSEHVVGADWPKTVTVLDRECDARLHKVYEAIDSMGGLKFRESLPDDRLISFTYVRGALGVEVFRE